MKSLKQVWAAARRFLMREAHTVKNCRGTEGDNCNSDDLLIICHLYAERQDTRSAGARGLRGDLDFPPTSLWTPIPP